MDTSILEEIGLTNAQIKVYLALLKLGEVTSGPIIKKSELQNSVVYNALNQLMELGLVSFILKGKRKHFSASSPKNIIKIVEERKERVEKFIPELLELEKENLDKQSAQVFQGWKGVYNAFDTILNELPQGSEYVGFAAGLEEEDSKESRHFFREFQKKRSTKKFKIRLIANNSEREKIRNYDYYEVFGMPQYKFVDGIAPLGVIIFKDKILNVTFGKKPIAVIIESEQIANSFKGSFNAMWKIANK